VSDDDRQGGGLLGFDPDTYICAAVDQRMSAAVNRPCIFQWRVAAEALQPAESHICR
jgi:hypothetical protein